MSVASVARTLVKILEVFLMLFKPFSSSLFYNPVERTDKLGLCVDRDYRPHQVGLTLCCITIGWFNEPNA